MPEERMPRRTSPDMAARACVPSVEEASEALPTSVSSVETALVMRVGDRVEEEEEEEEVGAAVRRAKDETMVSATATSKVERCWARLVMAWRAEERRLEYEELLEALEVEVATSLEASKARRMAEERLESERVVLATARVVRTEVTTELTAVAEALLTVMPVVRAQAEAPRLS